MIPVSDPELERQIVRYEFVKRALIIFTAVLVTACFGFLIAVAQQNNHLGERIQDCTQPSGQCYQRGKRETAQAVSNINTVIVLAAACSVGLPPNLDVAERQAQIQSCVIDRLAQRKQQ